jgi:hypothetical protein
MQGYCGLGVKPATAVALCVPLSTEAHLAKSCFDFIGDGDV